MGDKATEVSGVGAGGDKRLTIDAGVSGLTISADITRNEGRTGLVVRYIDESNWVMVWYMPSLEYFSVGRRTTGCGFKVERRIDYDWETPGTKNLKVTQDGDDLTIYKDNVALDTPVNVPYNQTATSYGLFDFAGVLPGECATGNFFDNFTVEL